jgi:hypothetical protein
LGQEGGSMTALTRPGRRAKRKPARPREARTWGSTLRDAGRLALWAFIGLTLWTGAKGVLSPRAQPATTTTGSSSAASWPDDDARAFSVEFARAYLTRTSDPVKDSARVAGYVSSAISGQVAPAQSDSKAPPVTVATTTVARTQRVSDKRGTVTVAAVTSAGTRYLTVPVERDKQGGLVVADLPAPAPAPARAQTTERDRQPLASHVRDTLEPAVTQALRAYLKDDANALRFVTAPGHRIRPVGGYSLDTVNSITETRPPTRARRFLAVTAAAKDTARASYLFGFELSLAFQRDRWLVETVNQTGPR